MNAETKWAIIIAGKVEVPNLTREAADALAAKMEASGRVIKVMNQAQAERELAPLNLGYNAAKQLPPINGWFV